MTEKSPVERPLSPHLQIYRPQLTSFTSIMHRFSGIALAAGSLLLVYWLWAAAYSPDTFACFQNCSKGILWKLMMVGWTLAFFYHFGNGIRHLFWDMGKGYSIPTATKSGLAVIAFALIMTAGVWIAALTHKAEMTEETVEVEVTEENIEGAVIDGAKAVEAEDDDDDAEDAQKEGDE